MLTLIKMNRKIEDKHVEIIKTMLSKGYSTRAIMDEMFITHGTKINSNDICGIRYGQAYADVKSELNDKILSLHSSEYLKNKDVITGIKFALANGYRDSEILKVYRVTPKLLCKIKMLNIPFYNIAPEFNDGIRLLYGRRKKANIDKNTVNEIKRQYVLSNGEISLAFLAETYGIASTTVSTILNLKTYTDYGKSFNAKISTIKKREKREKERTREMKKQHNKCQSQIMELCAQKKKISEMIKNKRTLLKEIQT
jgi:hypothetical protein